MIKKLQMLVLLIGASAFLCMSCSVITLEKSNVQPINLPGDTGGEHTPFVLGSTDSPYGFYLYIPGGYETTAQPYPLLIFLHGSGERGDSDINPDALDKVLSNGPPKLIRQGTWDPPYPMIVASLQCPTGAYWDPAKVHETIEYFISEYRINVSRVYMTGLSMGGYGTFNYLGRYGDDSYVAAAVPICGSGNTSQASQFKHIPLWAFHGMEDTTVSVSGSIDMVEAINAEVPDVRAKLTLYPDVGHNSWSRTYDGSGMGTESGDYDAFDESIFRWMFRYTR